MGALYSWYAAMNFSNSIPPDSASNFNPSGVQGVCPSGWHLPSAAEYEEMIAYLGGKDQAGKSMKDVYTDWGQEDIKATNVSGFSALPAGYMTILPVEFESLTWTGRWWTTSGNEPSSRLAVEVNVNIVNVMTPPTHKLYGLSVRCVKD
jgi:uncharacterized protein (TIGR02145 family)